MLKKALKWFTHPDYDILLSLFRLSRIILQVKK